jgi:uncharacterized zinc-type alcohol dehydrogenase-like protein
LGHEAVGRVIAIGEQVHGLRVGQRVGVGWNAGSCMHCHECMTGQHNLCSQALPTIVGHQGGFADKIRAHWLWTIPLPDTLDITSAGPLLCGGITVFSPLYTYGIKPTHSVGVVGIGGLGHIALKFAKAWGCEVTAFTSSESKAEEAKNFGAHHIVSSRDSAAMGKIASSLDILIVTVNVSLDWSALLKTLKPNGRMHVVGVVLDAIPVAALDLIMGQKSVSGSPTGDPAMIATMLEFAARHQIAPQVEHFPMSQINDAFEHLAAGKARYRIVLDGDFA